MKAWAVNVGAAWSQFWNAVWGGNRDQSFCSRSYEAKLAGKRWAIVAVAVLDVLFFFQPDHCATAFHSDDERTYR